MTTSTPGRWQLAIDVEDLEPAGSIESAQRAVARLGPFKHRLYEEAQRLGPWDALGGRLALSEELAFNRVRTLAALFNSHCKLEQSAPRAKVVLEQLRALEAKAGELAQLLESLDDMTRHSLRTSGTGISISGDLFDPDIYGADIEGLPGPAGWDEGQAPRWIVRLKGLSRHANAAAKMFLLWRGIEDPDHPDKGGNKNLWKDLRGSARWALTQEGWYVYEMFKPEQASGTDGGAFHLFLMDVFEFATGLDPEEHSKLIHSVKMVCTANRRYSNHKKELQKLETEELKFKQRPSITPEEYYEAVGRKRLALEQTHQELWQALYPHNYRELR